jgi:glycosyltransferase involved in cell wall biosynthesis
MRLLYLSADPGVPVLGHKGASVHVRELVAALVARGVSVVLASPSLAPSGESLPPDVELVWIEPVLPKTHDSAASLLAAVARQAAEIETLARSHGVNAVYERFSLFSDGGVRTARALSIPHVLEVNAPLRAEAARFRSLPHADVAATTEARVLAMSGRLLAVSRELAGSLVADGVEVGKVDVVPNAVDPVKFTPHRAAPNGEFTVGFAGSLKPWHGVEVLLAAFRRAREQETSLRLEIIGDGPAAPSLAAELADDGVTWLGRLSHAATIARMSGWQTGVAPYPPFDSFYFSPLKVIEYMAAGACPVASDLGQIRDLLGGGTRGLLVPAGDPDALAQALVWLARDVPRARELGRRAREYALTTLTWDRNAETVLRALGPLAAAA